MVSLTGKQVIIVFIIMSIQCTGTYKVTGYNRIDYTEQQCSLVKITITS